MRSDSYILPIYAIALIVGIGAVTEAYAASRGAGLSRTAAELWYVCFSYSVAWWVELDRKARGIAAPLEYAAFMFFAWPLLAPYYLFRSRRWRGLALGLGLILLSTMPDLMAMAAYLLLSGQ